LQYCKTIDIEPQSNLLLLQPALAAGPHWSAVLLQRLLLVGALAGGGMLLLMHYTAAAVELAAGETTTASRHPAAYSARGTPIGSRARADVRLA